MRWKLLGAGTLVAIVLVALVVVAAIGGMVWILIDGKPLVRYDASPATVPDAGQQASGYRLVNATAFDVAPLPWPIVRDELRVRVYLSVYLGGVDPSIPTGIPQAGEPGSATGSPSTGGSGSGGAGVGDTGGAGAATEPLPDVSTIDAGNVSIAMVMTSSAMQLGPVAFNPVVYASDPGVLEYSGLVVDALERRANWTVTDVRIRSTARVSMPGRETEMTEFRGTMTSEGSGEEARVTVHLARVVHEGDLVIAVAVSPDPATAEARFVAFLDHLDHGE